MCTDLSTVNFWMWEGSAILCKARWSREEAEAGGGSMQRSGSVCTGCSLQHMVWSQLAACWYSTTTQINRCSSQADYYKCWMLIFNKLLTLTWYIYMYIYVHLPLRNMCVHWVPPKSGCIRHSSGFHILTKCQWDGEVAISFTNNGATHTFLKNSCYAAIVNYTSLISVSTSHQWQRQHAQKITYMHTVTSPCKE